VDQVLQLAGVVRQMVERMLRRGSVSLDRHVELLGNRDGRVQRMISAIGLIDDDPVLVVDLP
jgi:hypothetical protein